MKLNIDMLIFVRYSENIHVMAVKA